MKLAQHLDVGERILEKLKIDGYGGYLNSRAFLLGNISPDLNCVYPAHRLTTTEKRLYRKLKVAFDIDIKMIRSFTLGVITHYVCDYFTFAHAAEKIGMKHKTYESSLMRVYNSYDMNQDRFNLDAIWLELQSMNKDKISTVTNNSSEELNLSIIKQLESMSEIYKANAVGYKNNKWQYSKEQMLIDLEFITFVSYKAIQELLMHNMVTICA